MNRTSSGVVISVAGGRWLRASYPDPDTGHATTGGTAAPRAPGGVAPILNGWTGKDGERMATRIVFNGKEYSSVEAMPEEVRRLYEAAMSQLADADRDGIPDSLERGGTLNKFFNIHHTSITVDGKTYGSVEDMPADVRRVYEEAMDKLDADRDGIPDALQSGGSGRESAGRTGDETHSVIHKSFRLGKVGEAGRRPGMTVESNLRPAMLLLMLIVVVALIYWLL